MIKTDFADSGIIAEIFSSSQVIAVVGLSEKTDRPSYRVAEYLQKAGYVIIPVNPNAEIILGEKSYPDLLSIPINIDVVDVFRRGETVGPVVDEAINKKAKAIWFQEGVINEAEAIRAKRSGLKVVMDRCMLKEHSKLNR